MKVFELALCVILLCASLPLLFPPLKPTRKSWWYPDPTNWGYDWKLWVYAVLWMHPPVVQVFVKAIALLMVSGAITGIVKCF